MRKPMSALVFGVVLVLAACASAQGGSGSKVKRASINANSSLITQKELDQFPSATAYAIVERLHPQWLQNRAQSAFPGNSSNEIQVYLGDSKLGGVDELQNYTGAQLASIQYLDAGHATMRYGVGNTNGAIILKTR